MTPTLADGQWVVVRRGAGRIQPGDIAVFISPLDHQLVIKRCVLKDEMNPVVDHGWLVTPWGQWFLTGTQWDRLDQAKLGTKGSFFMVGDNQFRSLDSRNYGYIHTDSLIGKVLLRSKHG